MIVTILAFIVVLGITITIHEFGHFAMAKLLKIRVLTFSIGFGPRLLGFRRGGTDYRISALPLGGFVKMAGENDGEERQGAPDEFLSHPRWHRFLVAIAGPSMNIALAVVVFTFNYLEGVRVPRYVKEAPIVGPVVENSIARRAGLKSGDRIVSVGGNSVRTWEEMEIALATAPKDSLEVVVERNGDKVRLRFDPPEGGTVDHDALGFKFTIPRILVFAVYPDSPAHKAGLKEGDEILSVQGAGKIGRNYDEVLNIISESKGVPLDVEVRRPGSSREPHSDGQSPGPLGSGEILHFRITPVETDGRVVIGFVPEVPYDFEKYNIGQAFVRSIRRTFEMSALVLKIIGRLFTGSASVRSLSGPIEIARISGNAARSGSARVFFEFLAFISLQLGVLNLLPIPILDGGVIALLLVEGIMRRDLSLALKEKLIQVGFVFLILIMVFVVYNDLSKIVNFDKLFR